MKPKYEFVCQYCGYLNTLDIDKREGRHKHYCPGCSSLYEYELAKICGIPKVMGEPKLIQNNSVQNWTEGKKTI